MSTTNPLIEQYTTYLRLQKQIAKAIDNRDEPLLKEMKVVSQDLFLQLEEARAVLVGTTNSVFSQEPISRSNLATLIQLMEQAQRQVQENETALDSWLGQMNVDLQQYRKLQPPRGLMATYIQQKQAESQQAIEGEPIDNPPESWHQAPSQKNPASPWAMSSKDPETVGHQVNHQT